MGISVAAGGIILAGAFIAYYYVFFVIYLTNMEKTRLQRKTVGEYTTAIINSLLALILLIPLILITLLTGLANSFASWWPAYLALTAGVLAADAWVQYGNEVLTTYDQVITQVWVPFYRFGVMTVAEITRIFYDFTICIWNLFNNLRNIFLEEAALIAVNECDSFVDWQMASQAFVDVLEAPYIAALEFIAADGLEPYNGVRAFESAANVIASSLDLLTCYCEDASIVFAWLKPVVQSSNLHNLLNNILNIPADFLRPGIVFLVELFSNLPTPFSCPGPPGPAQDMCYLTRAPKLDGFFDNIITSTKFFGAWVGDIVAAVLSNFFGFSSSLIPDISFVFSAPLGYLMRVLEFAIDVLTHIDLVFTNNYLSLVDWAKPVFEFYCVPNGIETFWQDISDGTGVPQIARLGTGFGQIMNSTIEILIAQTRLTQVLLTDPVDTIDFATSYDYNPIVLQWRDGWADLSSFASFVNGPLGDIVEYFYKTMSDIMIFIFQITINVQTLIVGTLTEVGDLETDVLDPIIADYFDDSRRLAAANGNFFRQFGQFDPVAPCPEIPLSPTPIGVTGGALDTELFCCLGNFVHAYSLIGFEVSYLFFEFFNLVIDLRAGSISLAAFGAVLNDFADNMERLVDRVDDLIDSFGCSLVFPFHYATCPNTDILTDLADLDPAQTTIPLDSIQLSNFFRRPISAYFNATLRPFIRGPAILIFGLRDLNNCGYGSCTAGEVTDIICYFIVSTYDLTVAAFAEIFFAVWNIVACLIPGTPPGIDAWDLFGWDGLSSGATVPNLRDELCRVIDAVLRVAQFIVNVFNSAGGFFTSAITFIEQLFTDGISVAFNNIAVLITGVFSAAVDALQDQIDMLEMTAQLAINTITTKINEIIFYVNQLLCFASGLGPAVAGCVTSAVSDPIDFSFNIDIPSQSFDLGVVDFTVPGFDQDIDFQFPDFAGFGPCVDNIDLVSLDTCGSTITGLGLLSIDATKRGSFLPLLRSGRVVAKRSDFMLQDYIMLEENGHLVAGPAAKRGDPDGVVLYTPPKMEDEPTDESDPPEFEELLGAPNSTDLRIYPDSPCYPLAMYVLDENVDRDLDGTLLVSSMANGTNASTFDFGLKAAFNLSANATQNERRHFWGRMARLDDLQWCLATTMGVNSVNRILQLSNDTMLPSGFIYSPFVTFNTVMRGLTRFQNIFYYQIYKSDFVPILQFNRTSDGGFDLDNSTDYSELIDEQLHFWFQWASSQNITDVTTLRFGAQVDTVRILYDLFTSNTFSQLSTDLHEIWGFLRTFLYEVPFGTAHGPGVAAKSYKTLQHISDSLIADTEAAQTMRNNLWDYLASWFQAPLLSLSPVNRANLIKWKQDLFNKMYEMSLSSDPKIQHQRRAVSNIKARISEAFYLNAINRGADRAENDPINYMVKWMRQEHPKSLYEGLRETEGYRNTRQRRDRLEEDILHYKKFRVLARSASPNVTDNVIRSTLESRRDGLKLVFDERATFGGLIDPLDLDPCIAGACLECRLLDVLIDRVVFEICDCVEALLDTVANAFNYKRSLTGVWGGDPASVPFPSTYATNIPEGYGLPLRRHDGSTFYPEDEVGMSSNDTRRGHVSAAESRSTFRGFFSAAYGRTASVEIIPSPFNLNGFFKNLILAIPRAIFGDFDYDTLVDELVSFFTQTDFASKDSFYFYLRFLLGCRGPNYKCDNTTDVGEGVGLAAAIPTILIVLIVGSLIVPRVVPGGNTIVVIAWTMVIALILIFAYRWTGACGFILPDCLADDAFDIMAYFDVDCTPWHIGLPGLTNPICPTSSTGFRRPFADCSKPPYNFNDGTRNLFTTLEIYWPEFNAYFLRTSNLLFVFFRDFNYLRNAATFPFPSGDVPDDFQSCNKLTLPNFFALTLLFTASALSLVLVGYAIYQFLLALLGLVTLIMEMMIALVDQSSDPENQQTILTEKSPETAAIAQAQTPNFSASSPPPPPPPAAASFSGAGLLTRMWDYVQEQRPWAQHSRRYEERQHLLSRTSPRRYVAVNDDDDDDDRLPPLVDHKQD